MNHHGILLAPLTPAILLNPSPLLPCIFDNLIQRASHSFTVIFISPLDQTDVFTALSSDPVAHWRTFQNFLAKVYSILAAAQWQAGRVTMDVEIRFTEADRELAAIPRKAGEHFEIVLLAGHEALVKHPALSKLVSHARTTSRVQCPPMPSESPIPLSASSSSSSQPTSIPVAAVGGTFDHLHAAHKLLLHLSLFLCTRKLIVGVMSDKLLSSKTQAELVEPLESRIWAVEQFLIRQGARRTGEAGGTVEMDVVEIQDAYGPTAWDHDIQALVISKETTSGGDAVNRVRREKGLSELAIYSADVISSTLVQSEMLQVNPVRTQDLTGDMDEQQLKQLKLSSTAIRQWIAEHPEHHRP